jgi:hypothetical protein
LFDREPDEGVEPLGGGIVDDLGEPGDGFDDASVFRWGVKVSLMCTL